MAANIYLCHVEPGKAHAFAAVKQNSKKDEWFLLDSLMDNPLPVVSSSELFTREELAGRASVVCVRDFSREVIVVGST